MPPSDGTVAGDVMPARPIGDAVPVSKAGGQKKVQKAKSTIEHGRNTPPDVSSHPHHKDANGDWLTRIINFLTPSIKMWQGLIILLTVAPMAGYTIIQPYQQSIRESVGCGPLCIGSMTSVSSGIGLFGAPLVGAMSDHRGRRFALALGTCALAISFLVQGFATSLIELWIAVVIPALFSHNFTITKAVVADLSTDSERATTLAYLGLAAGLGFMCGPVVQLFIKSYQGATWLAVGLQVVSLGAVFLLPCAATKAAKGKEASKWELSQVYGGVWDAIKELGELAVAAPPAVKAILFLRFALSMGYHLYITVMNVILKERFGFGPSEYSNYFAFIGLVYGGSQILSKFAVNATRDDPTKMVMLCTLLMGVGRYCCAITENITFFYASVTLTVLSLGVLNNTINTTVTRIGSSDKVGGLMGVLDTAEKLAGVVGPTIGGLLYSYDKFAPVLAVCAGYVGMCVMVSWSFPRYVVPSLVGKIVGTEKAPEKEE